MFVDLFDNFKSTVGICILKTLFIFKTLLQYVVIMKHFLRLKSKLIGDLQKNSIEESYASKRS